MRTQVAYAGYKRFLPGIHFVWIPGFLCVYAGSRRVSRQAGSTRQRASGVSLISAKNL